ncbi:Hypp7984 [Branchiostoma lanceolatum]|uniref:Hypp7984 protein n=1 Tax=Branchiostoma lanceolatum TaxID=7740 RepID=A0A8J9Z667_BRALA|nr:Hypp7984 [Branchiostoma lanceolatum]
MANMEELTQINGRWQHDHSQNENYDDYLRENGMGWFARKMMQWLKFSPVEEYIVNGNQITYRNYANQNRPFEMTQTVGQPPIATFAPGFGSFQLSFRVAKRLSNMAKMEQIAQISGRWQQDHSLDENYDLFLRENGMGWFVRKLIKWFKLSAVEEYIVNGDQITYRQYTNQNRPPYEVTLTVGQPPITTYMEGLGHFQTILLPSGKRCRRVLKRV